jgi:hypothetical protein
LCASALCTAGGSPLSLCVFAQCSMWGGVVMLPLFSACRPCLLVQSILELGLVQRLPLVVEFAWILGC